MVTFPADTTFTLTVDHVYEDTALTVTAFEFEILDSTGEVLLARDDNPDFELGTDSSSVIIDSDYTDIGDTKVDVRQINCFLTTAEGVFSIVVMVMLKKNPLLLTAPVDSFQTYPESILNRTKVSENLEYYDALTDEIKVIALENAFRKLSTLKFVVGNVLINDITSYEPEDYNTLNADFLTALKKAQIVEANELVEDSPVVDKIRQGIISETIGESSMFFRQSEPLPSKYPGISDKAYLYLRKWLYRNTTNSQIWRIARA